LLGRKESCGKGASRRRARDWSRTPHHEQGENIMSWQSNEPLLKKIRIEANPDNQPVSVVSVPPPLTVVGTGTDAVVVRHPDFPRLAFKVYAEGRSQSRENEYAAYRRLGRSPYFPVCYGKGSFYLVLSYEEGPTLYDCLVKGIPIPEQAIDDVEKARDYARQAGLNPRDIHLKNVLLQQGRAKLLDVSEYVKPGNDGRWDHLVQAYRKFYPLIAGRKIPVWLIEMVKKTYYRQVAGDFSVSDFGRRFLPFIKR
jgi:hypothetical protein